MMRYHFTTLQNVRDTPLLMTAAAPALLIMHYDLSICAFLMHRQAIILYHNCHGVMQSCLPYLVACLT